MQNMKMSKGKERPYKKVALSCAHKRRNDRQSTRRRMMTKVQKNLKAKKRMNKKKKLGQLPPRPPPPLVAQSFSKMALCYNPNLGLTTKARACEGADQVRNPKVTFHGPKSARKCEGVNPHTPK